ncbi:MAG: hypothetical protein RMJ97_02205 [Raineya sp.]|nr:hypothetical protein [Raineya sp.]MDW8295672.1 hypothetical protein [Raineya sp.]
MAFFIFVQTMDETISLETYFEKKNIDWQKLSLQEPQLWKKLQDDFAQMHPNSFEMQKKFILNKIRRKYPLKTF